MNTAQCCLRAGRLLCIALLALSAALLSAAEASPRADLSTLGGRDDAGRPVVPATLHGRAVAVFFFCGCPWCRDCADAWGQAQHAGLLASPPHLPPRTVVVFAGDAPAARAFAASHQLDPAQTIMLPDPQGRLSRRFHADVCPRVFVFGPGGGLCYTNDHSDDAPRRGPALVIVSRARTALVGSAARTPPGLTVIAGDGVRTTNPGTAIFRFAPRTASDTRPIQHDFLLRNAGPGTITLGEVKVACGCTAAVILGQRRLAPNHQAVVRLTLRADALPPGEIRKDAWVYVQGEKSPAAALRIAGTITPTIVFAPAVLDFGRVHADGAPLATRVVSAALDQRLVPGGRPPTLRADTPLVTVTPCRLSPDAVRLLPHALNGRRAVLCSYAVRLRPGAPLGLIGGQLAFRVETAGPALGGAGLPLSGELAGRLAAEPPLVLFDVLPLGRTQTRRIMLWGMSAPDLTSLRVTSDTAWITVRFVDSAPDSIPSKQMSMPSGLMGMHAPAGLTHTRRLEVCLGPQAPPGSVNAHIIVRGAAGPPLVITVLGAVLSQKA